MSSFVLPIPTIILQILLLLVAIAIESAALQRMLRIGYKTSVEYSITVNLLSSSLGWILFLYLQALIPEGLRTKLFNYILFAQFDTLQAHINFSLTIFWIFVTFLTVCFIEWQGLNLLQFVVHFNPGQLQQERQKYGRPSLRKKPKVNLTYSQTKRASVILIANIFSHTAVLIILFLSQFR